MTAEEEQAKEKALIWYKRGKTDWIMGRHYEPPDHSTLRRAYSEGWSDEIQGLYPDDEEVLLAIFGV